MTLVAVYLFAGGLAYHAMDDPHRSLANRYDASSRSVMMMVDALAAGQIMPEKTIRPDKRVILFNYYFQKSIAGPVLIGGIAFWIWEKSGTPTDLIFRRPCGISTNSRVPSPTGLRQRQDCHANSAEAHAGRKSRGHPPT